MPPLFDLAPGGVYLAATVTSRAVRSYRTISTWPRRSAVVCFLWHYPLTRHHSLVRRVLPGTVPRWSPDFPPLCRYQHSGGRPTLWHTGHLAPWRLLRKLQETIDPNLQRDAQWPNRLHPLTFPQLQVRDRIAGTRDG